MKLSRFDRVLGLNRERIERVYRGVGLLNPPARNDDAHIHHRPKGQVRHGFR
jgi:hypothetical protein